MVVDGGALVIAVGAALEIVGGATLGVLDGVGTVAGPVLFWPGPTVVRAPDWTREVLKTWAEGIRSGIRLGLRFLFTGSTKNPL
jgi:hypothetical protein